MLYMKFVLNNYSLKVEKKLGFPPAHQGVTVIQKLKNKSKAFNISYCKNWFVLYLYFNEIILVKNNILGTILFYKNCFHRILSALA